MSAHTEGTGLRGVSAAAADAWERAEARADAAEQECAQLAEHLREAREEIEGLREDAARLDWLAQHTNIELPGWVDEDGDPTDLWERACLHALGGLREVVDDAARRTAPQAVAP